MDWGVVPGESVYIRVREHLIHFRNAGSGDPVVLIHGIPTSSVIWKPIIPALAEIYHVIAPDLLGYGKSERIQGADVSLSAQAELLREFLEQVQLKPVTLIGHDIGGGIAQLMAVRYPDLVQRVILINSVCYDAWPSTQVKAMQEIKKEKHISVDKMLSLLRKGFTQSMVHPEKIQQNGLIDELLEPWSTPWGLGSLFQDARALDPRETKEIVSDLQQLEIPVLIIWGRDDTTLRIRLAEQLHRDLKDSELAVISRAGHFVMIDDPDSVSHTLLQFLWASGAIRIPPLEPVTA